MADNVQRAFASLTTNSDRCAALRALLRSTTFEERSYLFSIVSLRDDPLFVLPLELVLQVFSLLPVFSTWTLQSVSHRWRYLLSSDRFIHAAVSRWDTHNVLDSARSHPSLSSPTLESRFKHLKALRSQEPPSHTTLHSIARNWGPEPTLDLQGSLLAFVTSRNNRDGDANVVVRDLVSGKERRFPNHSPRYAIKTIVLSHALVAWLTVGARLRVSYHSQPTTEIQTVRLPSSDVETMAADGDIIVMVMYAFWDPSNSTCNILVYNAAQRQLRSIDCNAGVDLPLGHRRPRISSGLLVDSRGGLIDVFVHMWGDEKQSSSSLTHTRMSLDGERIHGSSWDTSILLNLHESMDAISCPTGFKDEYRIETWVQKADMRFSALFDAARGEFKASHRDATGKPVLFEKSYGKTDAFWKNVCLQLPTPEKDWVQIAYRVNDTFLVGLESRRTSYHQLRIRVLCFDPDIDVA